jgi:hypothetical protein
MPILEPAPVDLVPATTVEALMADTQRDLAAREAERVAREATADAAERAAIGGAADPVFHAWVATHVDRFAQLLRDEHEVEMRSLLDAADRRARACIERAQVDADVLLSYAQALGGGGSPALAAAPPAVATNVPLAPPATAQPSSPVPSPEPVPEPALPPLVWRPSETQVEEAPLPASPPAAEPVVVEVAAPVEEPPPPPWTPPVVEAPPVLVVPPAPRLVDAPPVLVVPPAPVVVPAPPPVVVAPPPVVVAPPPVVAPVVAAPMVEPSEPPPPPPPPPPVAAAVDSGDAAPKPEAADGATPAPAAKTSSMDKLKGLVHDLPTFAILQVLAVIVVLIIVLIRIG